MMKHKWHPFLGSAVWLGCIIVAVGLQNWVG